MSEAASPSPIVVTETFVRLYVFLTQVLDRCLDPAARDTLSEQELHGHLESTKTAMTAMLSVNPVVKKKIEQECAHVLALGQRCLTEGQGGAEVLNDLRKERVTLQNKTIALSDLLAVLRAL